MSTADNTEQAAEPLPTPSADNGHHDDGRKSKIKLAFAALGVVYGDIGTSPLYAMREALHPVVQGHEQVQLDVLRNAVLGVVSLLIWAMFVVVTLKYVFMLMRADNRGEGGILLR